MVQQKEDSINDEDVNNLLKMFDYDSPSEEDLNLVAMITTVP